MSDGSERREARRFNMTLPMRVLPREASGAELRAQTRDVSYRGLYFLAEAQFEVGATIDFVITLPQQATRGDDVNIRCQGQVVRVEPTSNGRSGIAAKIERYSSCTPLPDSRSFAAGSVCSSEIGAYNRIRVTGCRGTPMYHYDATIALEELQDEAVLPHPVRLRDMILRTQLGPQEAQALNHDFQEYLSRFGELQKLAQSMLERLAAGKRKTA